MKAIAGMVVLLFLCQGLRAQAGLRLSDSSVGSVRPQAPRQQITLDPPPRFGLSPIFPEYVRNNPQGFSYLCRMELTIEKKLPVGLWIKFDDGEKSDTRPVNRAYVRLKVFRF